MIKLFEWGRKICPKPLLGIYNKLFFTEGGLYLVFGGLTTVVSYLSYILPSLLFRINSMQEGTFKKSAFVVGVNIFSWVCAVLFAYFTNRRYVFNSDKVKKGEIADEFLKFVGSRALTLGLETALMLLLTSVIGANDILSKIIASVFVLIANYFLSKLIVFRKTRG